MKKLIEINVPDGKYCMNLRKKNMIPSCGYRSLQNLGLWCEIFHVWLKGTNWFKWEGHKNGGYYKAVHKCKECLGYEK